MRNRRVFSPDATRYDTCIVAGLIRVTMQSEIIRIVNSRLKRGLAAGIFYQQPIIRTQEHHA